ncbi:MAG: orotidine-5'-phosphate decarboxylase [Planctomycetota bacterium]
MPHFADMLCDAIRAVGSPVCVGLDPVLESLPAQCKDAADAPTAIERFSIGVVAAVAGVVAAVKFQSACFERYGSLGVAAMERSIAHARSRGVIVVLDAKRGDIGISASHYAAGAVAMGVHCVTVNGYLGMSGVEPFLAAGLGVFVLVRTSNPDSDAVQSPRLGDGRSVAELVADQVASLGDKHIGVSGLSAAGAVVGATKSADGLALRARMPRQIFLVPGYGAQGGTADDIRALLTPGGGGVLVTASRSVIYAKPDAAEAWQATVHHAAKSFAAEIAGVTHAA